VSLAAVLAAMLRRRAPRPWLGAFTGMLLEHSLPLPSTTTPNTEGSCDLASLSKAD